MPDHAHVLVEGTTADACFKQFMKRLKQSSGQSYAHRAKCRLWQEGYYDRVLRSEEEVKIVARYIIDNPVRAGLVREVQEYKWVGSDRWSIEELIESVR
jgi:REP element-mobilizing transposase RayT